ncbi:MAG: hypothetical protein C5B55_11825 [Blastocatellia bacterium]|nr:MAG: hypothetical protein C5B55_11825 [Blastocatellia bacterium]
MNPHFAALQAAYQLHFYLCLKTRYLHPLLRSVAAQSIVLSTLEEVCCREDYHLLESELTQDHLRVLVSLQPTQTVSNVVRMLKGNTDHEFRCSLADELQRHQTTALWAKGYFARSAGKVDLDVVRDYVARQVSHHGYKGSWTRPLQYCNPEFRSPAFPMPHCFCLLNYHIVLVTQERRSVFDEVIAPRLFEYVRTVGMKHRFAIDRIGLLPDHMHLVIEARPDVSIEEYVRAIMESTRYWMNKNYYGVLKETKAWDLWKPSYYAGTVGEYTTAQVKAFLKMYG